MPFLLTLTSCIPATHLISHLPELPQVLESLRQSLTTSLIPDRHMDFLRSKYILSEEDCDEINHPPTRKKKASKFLDILGKKGAEAYDALCASLKEEGTQTFLLKQLHEDFERRLRQYRGRIWVRWMMIDFERWLQLYRGRAWTGWMLDFE